MTARMAQCFAGLRDADRAGFIAFVTAGDPDPDTSFAILDGLPGAGADIIELGMPFSDPMADGPVIQASSRRALNNGACMTRTLELAAAVRRAHPETPLVLMGYYNPIHAFGPEAFVERAAQAGVDGVIIVDLPPEEDSPVRLPADGHDLSVIRLATPTTDDSRLPTVMAGAGGFVYYVSITGITGAAAGSAESVGEAVRRLRQHTQLPVAVGFGIRTASQAADVARVADGVVAGSAIVSAIAGAAGKSPKAITAAALDVAATLADGVHGARKNP